MTFKKSSIGLQLETAHFGNGVIRVVGSHSGQSEVNYFLTDHLGSVRVIVDGNGVVKERNDYYPFGARHVKGDYPKMANRLLYSGKEEQVTGDLDYLDYGARMYDSGLGRWFGGDPLQEDFFSLSPYNYCGNNPILFIDPSGALMTHYVDENYDVVYQTNDGSDDVVMIPNARMGEFMANVRASDWDRGRVSSWGWNQHWKDEFGLAGFQFSRAQLAALDQFNSKWSRDNAARYLLNPTFSNALRMSFSEVLSQWTNPGLVAGGLSAGLVGWQGVLKGFARNASSTGEKIAIQFGKTENQIYHAFRHTDILGLDRIFVQSSIQSHFKTVSSQVKVGKPFNQVIKMRGVQIQYTVFKLSDGTFNIGRIHEIK